MRISKSTITLDAQNNFNAEHKRQFSHWTKFTTNETFWTKDATPKHFRPKYQFLTNYKDQTYKFVYLYMPCIMIPCGELECKPRTLRASTIEGFL